MRRILPVLAAGLMAAAHPVRGQEADVLDQARLAIAAGRLDEAERILDAARRDVVDRNDLDFLRGAAALARNDYQAAIAAFRAILVRDPALHRVRLELARALFLYGDDGAARHHFEIAQAADLPPEVRRKVAAFLDEIRRRKRWSVEVTLGLAPDSNVNGGSSARVVDMFGIPFTLDDAARRNSGIGAAIGLGASYQMPLGRDTRLVTGGRLSAVDYAGGRFDDATLSAHAGPRFLIGAASEVTLSATAARRWYGNDGYLTALGGKVEGRSVLDPRLMLDGAVSLQGVDYDHVDALDGPVAQAGLGLTFGLDAASLLRLDASVARERADHEPLRNSRLHVGASYFRELAGGYAVTLGAGLAWTRYDAALPAFGFTRRDETLTARASLSNRRLDLFGFTPVVSVTHTARRSNIDLYESDRTRVELALTRNF